MVDGRGQGAAVGFPVVEASGVRAGLRRDVGRGWACGALPAHRPSTTTAVKTQPEAEGGGDSGKNTKPETGNLNSVSHSCIYFSEKKNTHTYRDGPCDLVRSQGCLGAAHREPVVQWSVCDHRPLGHGDHSGRWAGLGSRGRWHGPLGLWG